jgi:spore maturation protein CgeB
MGHEPIALGSATPRTGGRVLNPLVQLGARASLSFGERLQRGIVARARDFGTELVITIDAELLPRTVSDLRARGARVALWFPDALSNLGRQLMFVAPYDLVCFKDPALVERTRRLLDLPVQYLPEACNPSWHRPPDRASRESAIVVVGNMYPTRVRLLERLAKAGIPLRLYGPPWARWLHSPDLQKAYTGRYVAREEKALVFRSAAAVLNTLHPSEMESLNCRLFEAAGCGGAVLSERRPELDKCFESDEVASFTTFDELVDQARTLLADHDGARAMGNRASARAHRDHTYSARLSELTTRVLG